MCNAYVKVFGQWMSVLEIGGYENGLVSVRTSFAWTVVSVDEVILPQTAVL